MMIDPPIDELLEISGCKYALACLTSKRVRILIDKKPEILEASGMRPVTYALKEIYEREVEARLAD